MRVGILSYPMLFQRDGGLQIQVRETISALNRLQANPARPLERGGRGGIGDCGGLEHRLQLGFRALGISPSGAWARCGTPDGTCHRV